jgi:hypothetical protein
VLAVYFLHFQDILKFKMKLFVFSCILLPSWALALPGNIDSKQYWMATPLEPRQSLHRFIKPNADVQTAALNTAPPAPSGTGKVKFGELSTLLI